MGQRAQAIVIERHLAPHLALDGATAGQLTARLVLEHKEVVAPLDWRALLEGSDGGGNLVAQELAIVGQRGEADPGFAGDLLQFVQVALGNRSNTHHSSPSSKPGSSSPEDGSASGAASTARPSSTPSSSACSGDSINWPVGDSA